jgi:hypothetical protein
VVNIESDHVGLTDFGIGGCNSMVSWVFQARRSLGAVILLFLGAITHKFVSSYAAGDHKWNGGSHFSKK